MDKENLLSPWLPYTGDVPEIIIFVRWYLRDNSDTWSAWVAYNPNEMYGSKYYGAGPKSIKFSSLDEGKKLYDKELVKLGYVFLTQEQWDKYMLLV